MELVLGFVSPRRRMLETGRKNGMRQMLACFGLVVLAVLVSGSLGAQQLVENFDAGVPGTWAVANNSSVLGTTSWFQGNAGVFVAQGGASNSFVAANLNAAGDGGDISDWLITPQLTNLQNGQTLTFFTRAEALPPAADRLEIRMCVGLAVTCVSPAAGATNVGSFTSLLATVNPALTTIGYPTAWTLQNIVLAGLPGGSNPGRIAFRYLVPTGGPGPIATNSDFIGLDTLNLTPVELTSFSVD
jgi:hypothetical protein